MSNAMGRAFDDEDESFAQSKRTIAISLFLGSGGFLIFGIMPIVLGGLLSSGRVNTVQLGWAATVETLFIAFGMLLATKLLRNPRMRWIVIGGGIAMAVANLLTLMVANPGQLLLTRGVAGLGEGILVAVTGLSIAYSQIPAKLAGIFLATSALPPLALSYILPSFLMPRFGDGAGLGVLAITGLLCAIATEFIRDDFAPRQTEETSRIRWTPLTVIALSATLTSSAGFGAAWAYVDPIGQSHGLSLEQIGFAVGAAIVGQFLISALVAAIGWRLPMLATLVLASVAHLIVCILLLWANTPLWFSLILSVFALCWQGAMPFAQSLLCALDKSRAVGPLIFPFQLLGLALGPLAASLVADQDISRVAVLAAGFLIAALLAYLYVAISAARVGITLPKTVEHPA